MSYQAKSLLLALCTAALLGSVAACSSRPPPPASPSTPAIADATRTNALSAMHGEALAHAKYLAFATQAQQAGRTQAAQDFTNAAQTEHTDHFASEADLIGLGGDIAANLRDAINGETNEVNTLYPGFANQANADNDPAAASAFSEIGADEATHLTDFQTALNAVSNPGSGAPVPAGTTPAPVAITAGPPRSAGTTLENVRTAMQGEAFAYAKYLRYADQAGNPQAADLFREIAGDEKTHQQTFQKALTAG